MTIIETKEIKLSLIDQPEIASRFTIETTGIEELAASIRELGLLQPLVVRKTRRRFRLVAGNRRLLALKMLGEKVAACRVVDADESKASAMTVVENLQRADLNPVEEAVAIQEIKNSTGWTDSEIGLKISKRREYVTRSRSLLDLDEDTLDALAIGELKPAHAYELRRLNDLERRSYWRHWTIHYGASVRQLRDWIKDELTRPAQQSGDVEASDYAAPAIDPDAYILRCEACGASQHDVMLKSMWICQRDYETLQAAFKQSEGEAA